MTRHAAAPDAPGPTFTAPPPAPEPPAVDAFLTAVDQVMNSNTLLLTAAHDAPITVDNRQDVLCAFLRDPLFERLMYAADDRRGWHNLSQSYADQPPERPLPRAGFRAGLSPLDRAALVARLRWMLHEGPSPHLRHCSAARADALVRDLVRELLGADGAAWSFAAVDPDFLRSTGYHTGEEPQRPAYFDGGASDTATFLYRDRVFHLLLTNGCP
ncbi:hypothetical protein RM844_20905 [Streptomyces sp. DSM 44915]|uniref:Uncharacterized protein n=1 Tax=Streptomyces chisholmiae TaxID=3075540 RepID=A0ABU2JUT8_9ACTN|nr:hypothetical protein [Streptomyces sp. DSM 44915]MDT0268750.1 hypothetical protein [Streptomyces sp. DSM 44915]